MNDNNNHLLEALTCEGVLINVSVRYWRATKKLNPEDLGLNPDDVTDRFISLGHKRLLPREKFEKIALIESRAHALIEANTFPFLNGLGHFLPNTKLQEVTQKLELLSGEFNDAKKAFLDKYADLRQEACTEWLEAARHLVSDPERMVEVISASFPEPGRMERSFGFGVQLFQVRVPEGLHAGLVTNAEHERVIQARDQAARGAAEQIQQGVRSFVADCVTSMRQQTAQLCDEMLASMREGKTGVHQKTLNRLIYFIDQFKQLNFADDEQMEAELERVRQEFLQRTAEEYRDDAFARSRLEAGLTGLANTARELARADAVEVVQRFGNLGQRRFHLAA